MNFGQALEELKQGKAVSREGWNGKGMFIYLNKGNFDCPPVDLNEPDGASLPLPEKIEGISGSLFESGPTGSITRLPNLNMKAATGSTVTGWLASQTDLLAEDWGVVEV